MNDLEYFTKLRRMLLLLLALPLGAFAQQTVKFALPTFSAYENGTNAIVVVTRTGGTDSIVTVNFSTIDGSAQDVQDYIGSSGTLTFGTNEVIKTVAIALVDNLIQEPDETFTVFLSEPVGAVLGDQTNTTVVIFDDDTDIFFSQSGYQVEEWGTNAIITLVRSPVSQAPASVEASAADGTATGGQDYITVSTNIVFTNNQAIAFLVVPILNDCALETNETVLLSLANPIGARLGAQAGATLTITNDDTGAGTLEFNSRGPATMFEGGVIQTINVQVARRCTNGGAVSVNYRVANSTNLFTFCHGTTNATAGFDYAISGGSAGTLNWAAGDGANKTISITINEDADAELVESIWLELVDPPTGGAVLGTNRLFEIQIIDNDLAAGAGDPLYNRSTFDNPSPGANNTVYAIGVYESPANPIHAGKAILGGDFTAVNAVVRNGIARLNPDGTVDTSFDPGAGADGFVGSVVVLPDDRVLIAGGFGSIDNISRSGIARLTSNGALDTSFSPGAGTDGPIFAMILLADGRILIGGDFSHYNNTAVPKVARLNADGSLDATFNPGAGPDGPVHSLAQQADGRILIGGSFSVVGDFPALGIARLTANGNVDLSFSPVSGADDTVYAMAVQSDGRILAGGAFETYDGEPRRGVARLNADGTLDNTFNPGSGVNGLVYAIDLQADGKPVIGGDFTSYNGTSRTNLARLQVNGTLDTTILDNHYNNASPGPNGFVTAVKVLQDASILIGGSFSRVGVGFSILSIIQRNNYAKLLGGITPTAGNAPGNFELLAAGYSVDENVGGGVLTIRVRRLNGNLGAVEVPYFTIDGSARDGVDYAGDAGTVTFDDCETLDQFFTIVITDNNVVDGNRTFRVMLGQPRSLGPNVINSPALGFTTSADVTIVDNDFNRGVIGFAGAIYTIDEGAVPQPARATITLTRTNGSNGQVTVQYATSNGSATAPADYTAATDTLTFGPGQITRQFTVQIVNDLASEFEETVNLRLFNVTGGAALGRSNAVLLINSDEPSRGSISFATNEFTVNEAAGTATVTLRRTSGSTEKVFVDVLTADLPAGTGSAREGIDYTGTTNTISFQAGETVQTITIPILADGLVEGLESLRLILTNATGGAALGYLSTSSLKIVDDDFYGALSFAAENLYVNEEDVFATITVERTGGAAEEVSADFVLTMGTASEGVDYIATNGTVVFPAGVVSQSFDVLIQDDAQLELNETIHLTLTNFAKASAGPVTNAVLHIIDDEALEAPAGSVDTFFNPIPGPNGFVNALALQLDGRIYAAGDFTVFNNIVRRRVARLHPDGSVDTTFNPGGGADDTISAMALQSDGKVVLGGRFIRMGNRNRSGIARLNQNGQVDTSFNPGSGADNPVLAIALDAEGKILMGGDFTTYNNTDRGRLARLSSNGSIDTTFHPGVGANGAVQALAVQPDGKIIVAGDFSEFDNQPSGFIVRLHPNGARDSSFQTANAANGFIHTVALQPDGKVVIAGAFTSVAGQPRNRIARLNADGTLDAAFAPGSGMNGAVFALALQPDGKLIVAGEFTQVNGVSRNRIVRLNSNGTLDLSINFGSGANNFILTALIQPDEQILIGGGFTLVNGFERRHIARLLGGADAGPGVLEFSAAEYIVSESSTNFAVQVVRTGGSAGAVAVQLLTADGTATAGSDYDAVATTLFFDDGQSVATAQIPIRDDTLVEPSETITLLLTNLSGDSTFGAQSTATITILNDDAVVGFTSPTYFVNENVVGGQATLLIERTGTTNGTVRVDLITITNASSASPGADYTPVFATVVFDPGVTNRSVTVPIFEDSFVEGNESVLFVLSNLVGLATLGISNTALSIIDNDFNRGSLTFAQPQYLVSEGVGMAQITILRTNGNTGAISVDYQTTNGTAAAGSDYEAAARTLTIPDGENFGIISIRILDDLEIEGNEAFTIIISNPTGGAVISGPSSAQVVISENDFGPGTIDESFDPGQGANALVRAIGVQGDGRVVVGGLFTMFDQTNRNYITRLNADGSHDLSFNAGTGASGPVLALGIMPDGRIVPGGNFTNFNGLPLRRIARLETNGPVDPNFSEAPAFNAAINAVSIQSDGRVLVGGGFSAPIRNVVQLQLDGKMDVTFDVGVGGNGPVHAVLAAPGNRAYIGGAFTLLKGEPSLRVARLQANGDYDFGFAANTITNGSVYALALQPDGKLIAAGDFVLVGSPARVNIARFNTDGSLDSSLNPGASANGPIFALAIQASGKIIIGGDFRSYDGQMRNFYARLNADGSLDPVFNPGNGADGIVYSAVLTADNNLLIGGDFHFVNGVPRNGVARIRASDGEARFTSLVHTLTECRLRLTTAPGVNYVLEASEDLVNWTAISTNNAPGGTLELIDPNVGFYPQRFYRARKADF